MIDIKKRKMLHLTELLDEKFLYTEKEALTKVPGKINAIEIKDTAQRRVEALYSSIDINNHVTTTRYIQWILDSFSIDDLKENRIKIFEINFQNEAKFKDTLEVHKQKISDEIYIIELTKAPEIQICRARIRFEKKL
jgi:acyl-ACP thioesterase